MVLQFRVIVAIGNLSTTTEVVCFVCLSCGNLPNHSPPHVSPPWWVDNGFIMFQPTVEKLLNIEQNFHSNFIWVETKYHRQIWHCSWYSWKAPNEKDFTKIIWKFVDQRCGRYWIFNFFVIEISILLQNVFGRKH